MELEQLVANCLRYLGSINDPAQRLATGMRLFGKRYRRDFEHLVP